MVFHSIQIIYLYINSDLLYFLIGEYALVFKVLNNWSISSSNDMSECIKNTNYF